MPSAGRIAVVSNLDPGGHLATPQSAGQRAGEVSRVIPAVNIARSGKTIAASAKTAVDWLDS